MAIAKFNASIRAFASITNPLQTRLDIVLTDFQPNGNNQCVPLSEADNIIHSALHQPIKINFQDGKESGHHYSYPIGTLTDVYLDGDVIRAKSVLWKTEYPEEDQYLRRATAEGKTLQTSWELYYNESEKIDDVEYLRGCQFAATVIVENPAYMGRTPILSIAEMERIKAESMDEIEKLRTELNSIYDWIITLFEKTYEIEEAERENRDGDKMIERMKKVSDAIDGMMSKYAELEAKHRELEQSATALKEQVESIEKEKAELARAEKLKTRKDKLQSVGIDDMEDTQIEELTDDTFTVLFNSAEKAFKRAQSSKETFIPEPHGTSTITLTDLAKAISEETKRR